MKNVSRQGAKPQRKPFFVFFAALRLGEKRFFRGSASHLLDLNMSCDIFL